MNLIYFHILLFNCISIFATNYEDITKKCQENSSTYIILPFGSGPTDARVLKGSFIAPAKIECYINFQLWSLSLSSANNYSIILVIEFFILEPTIADFCKKHNIVRIFNRNLLLLDICAEQNSRTNGTETNPPQYYFKYINYIEILHNNATQIKLQSINYEGIIKITASSSKIANKRDDCTANEEFFCVINRKEFCISKFLCCDGVANCGSYSKFDEAPRICKDVAFYIFWKRFIIAVIILFVFSFTTYYFILAMNPAPASCFFIYDDEANILPDDQSPPLCPADLTISESCFSNATSYEQPERASDLEIINIINKNKASRVLISRIAAQSDTAVLNKKLIKNRNF